MQGLIFLCIPTNEDFLLSLSLQYTCLLAKAVLLCMARKVVSDTWIVGFMWRLFDVVHPLKVVQCHVRYILAHFL